ncbi:hypothetical protein Tco_0495051, partial [Tanacetum coccineum]
EHSTSPHSRAASSARDAQGTPTQSATQPQQPTQGTDPKDKGKGILVEEPKKKKLTLQQIRALETTNDEEVARKICIRRKKEV